MTDDCYIPAPQDIAMQSSDNKQGRAEQPVDSQTADSIRSRMEHDQQQIYRSYRTLVDEGIAREISRINLPLSLYTEIYWQIDLHNLFHFLQLRLDHHAQREIREYAEVMLELVRKVCPIATEAFENHRLNGRSFSADEVEAIRAMSRSEPNPLEGRALEIFLEKLK